jgi:hypothetical protein
VNIAVKLNFRPKACWTTDQIIGSVICSRGEAEEPNMKSASMLDSSAEPGNASPVSVQLEDEAFHALAIARFENEGGLTFTAKEP